jgi:hypothetical protein
MVKKVSEHVDPVEVENRARTIKIAGMLGEENGVEEDIEIPDVPLELND